MLDLRDGDGDMAVGTDLEPRAERGFAGVGYEVRRVGSGPETPGYDEPDPRAAAD